MGVANARFQDLKAVQFNGTSQLASVNSPTFLGLTSGAIVLDYRPTTINTVDGLKTFMRMGSSVGNPVVNFGLRRIVGTLGTSNYIEIFVRATDASPNSSSYALTTTPILAGVRYHIAISCTGGVYTARINNVAQTINNWFNTGTGQTPIWFGGATYSSPVFCIGGGISSTGTVYADVTLNNIGLTNAALTSGQMNTIYNGGIPISPRAWGLGSALVEFYACGDRGDTTSTILGRINGNNLTTVGSPTFVTLNTDEMSIAPSVSVGDTTARISFGTKSPSAVSVRYSTDPTLASPLSSASVLVTSATDNTGKIDITGLTANTTYYYSILVNGVLQTTSSFPSFKTFVANGAATSFSFAFGSCSANYGTVGSDAVFDTAIPAGARFLVHLGDLAYCDTAPAATTLAGFRNYQQIQLKGSVTYAARYKVLRATTPVFTLWDDHDITNNYDQGPATAIRLAAKQAMQEYPGAQNPTGPTYDELYYAFQYGNVGFFMLDSRSFRSTNASTDNGSKTHLGSVQLAALKAWLLANKTSLNVKVICTSTPMHGYAANTGGDSFGGVYDTFQVPTGANGFRTERNDIWDYIDTNQIPGVIAISGDQHWAGAFKTTYASRARYEFMASPFNQSPPHLFSPVALTADPTNGPVFFKYSGANNIGVVTIDTSVSPATVSFQLYGAGGTLGSSYLKTIDTNAIDAGL